MAFRGSQTYIGIDIGGASLKIVELKNEKGRPKLQTYGYIEKPTPVLKIESTEAKQKIVETLKKVLDKAKVSTNQVVAALPSYTVFSSVITLPDMKAKELDAAVHWEAKKIVPMPLEKMVLSYDELTNYDDHEHIPSQNTQPNTQTKDSASTLKSTPKKYKKILLTAAPADLVNNYVELFKMAGLNLVKLETEAFALERALVGHDRAPIMIVDIGATTTSISVVVASVPVVNRSIDLGGQTITKTIASSLNVDVERAEQFKRDFGLIATGSSTNQIPKRIEFMVSSVVTEINYVLNLYHNQSSARIEKIILTGGSAWLPNLPNYLAQVLNVKVLIGDPWARVMYPVELKPVLAEIGPRMSIAVGLAMREIV
ncbi:MAG: pilus assembly protein PilM [Patescibacteria group bacterium]